MRLCGTMEYRGARYFLIFNQLVGKVSVCLISPRSVIYSDNKEDELPILTELDLIRNNVDPNYVMGAMERSRSTGKKKAFRNTVFIDEFFTALNAAVAYRFAPAEILIDSSVESLGDKVIEFNASNQDMFVEYRKVNSLYSLINISTSDMSVNLSGSVKYKQPTGIVLETVEVSRKNTRVDLSTLKSVDYNMLEEIVDLSFYRDENGKVLKDYDLTTTLKEFEDGVMTPLLKKYKEFVAKNGTGNLDTNFKLDLGVDTETTGLIFYKLSDGNEELDHMVSLPISWEDDQGRTICIDMEYFSNIELEYVLERLSPFLRNHDDNLPENAQGHVRSVPMYNVIEKEGPSVEYMSEFGDSSEILNDNKTWTRDMVELEVIECVEVNRKDIVVTTHNGPFDRRVFMRHGADLYIDEDTLQMAFTLNPKVVKGSNKLKTLTRKILGHETPELADLLGKGNEDKFRYISDRRVAAIYGCADVDYPKKIRKYFISIFPPDLLNAYRENFIWIMNELAESEYTGLRTDYKPFEELALSTQKNLGILLQFMQLYVGAVVSVRTQRNILTREFETGMLGVTREKFLKMLSDIRPEKDAFYEFKVPGSDVRRVLYEILKYPVKLRTPPSDKNPKGLPSVDKMAMKKLMGYASDPGTKTMDRDLIGADGKTVLIKADKFNSFKYPLAYVLSVYGSLLKEYTSYYKPVIEKNLEGRIFNSYSQARIETYRIMNASQTMKSFLKRLILPEEDHYTIVWDQMQVEPRIMQSFSGNLVQIEKFRDPEKDSHTEIGADVAGIAPHKLPKSLRKALKSVTLGKPYGSGDRKICEGIHEGVVNDDNLFDTRMKIASWEKANEHLTEMFEKFRDQALNPVKLPDGLREYITDGNPDMVVGMIKNPVGLYRLFDITNLDRETIGKVRRPAGNFPIQSMAAIIFRKILKRLRDRCREYGIHEKMLWQMLIHDELLMSVHKSIHPFLMYKLIHEACTVTLKGHTTYFVGINVGENWGDGKEDENEAPVKFVQRIIARWDAGEFRDDDYLNFEYTFTNAKGVTVTERGPKGYVTYHLHQYVGTRIKEVVESITEVKRGTPLDLKELLEKFSNYVVRAYVSTYYPVNGQPKNSKDGDEIYQLQFETWILEQYGEGILLKGVDGEIKEVTKGNSEIIDLSMFELDNDKDDEEDTSNWTFDVNEDGESEGFGSSYFVDDYDEAEELEELEKMFDFNNKGAKSFGDLLVKEKPEYTNLILPNNRMIVKVDRKRYVEKVKRYLLEYEASDGISVSFRTPIEDIHWVKVKGVDFKKLDEFVGGLGNGD